MAKCDLSIELKDGDQIVRGGDRVRGTVTVRPDSDFNCKGLDIRTRWETHGRGNIATGDVDSVIAFEGQWLAGQTYRYDFDLASGTWPPTYHGQYLTVEHVVRATARLPWKSDPTVAHPFRVYVTTAPESGAPPAPETTAGPITKAILFVVFSLLGLFFLLNPLFWLIGAIVAVFGSVWWFFRKVLPSRRLGPVEFHIENRRLQPGETLRAELVLKPQKNVTLNGIDLQLNAKEACVSGSGSNRTTHTMTVFEERVAVMEAGELRAGKEYRFPIEATVPMRPFYSIDLSDNDIKWSADLRIDIPRWPDWVTQEKLSVVPPSEPAAAAALLPGVTDEDLADLEPAVAGLTDRSPSDQASGGDEPAVSFAETVALVWEHREQPEMIEQLVQAVEGLVMRVSFKIERRSLYADSDETSFAGPQGTTFLATCEDPPLPITFFLPASSLAEIAAIERQGRWSGPAQVIGYDNQLRRLLVQAER